ncbi:hypothetical protein AAFF_G00045470 [Aldrovandia affinis]|uniref:Uncharacterized protein n=1 Tax=Aldrovandia affinis TaxID=143900 RepID=A0AAD7S2H4_9TELE|nr:hypothetical protein AAFF_G00045470 [Aldrovandia affinis]
MKPLADDHSSHGGLHGVRRDDVCPGGRLQTERQPRRTAARCELQFERLTRELEVERQIVASQLERCRLGTESPEAASGSSSEKSYNWRSADASTAGETKSRVTDSSQSPTYPARSDQEQAALYSPEQTSLHEREGSVGNSRSSTQMNSYSDSGYQDTSSYYSQNQSDPRLQHSYPGASAGPAHLRSSRAEGQTSVQAPVNAPAVSGRPMRRASSVQSRTQSPAYGSSVSPSRGSLRTSLGSAYGSPVVTEPKPLSSVFSNSTLPPSPRAGSPTPPTRAGLPPPSDASAPPTPVRAAPAATPRPTKGTRAPR